MCIRPYPWNSVESGLLFHMPMIFLLYGHFCVESVPHSQKQLVQWAVDITAQFNACWLSG